MDHYAGRHFHPEQTDLPRQVFCWADGILHQSVEVIQHRATNLHPVGIRNEWRPVIVDGKTVPYSHP